MPRKPIGTPPVLAQSAVVTPSMTLPIVLAGGDDSMAPLNPTVARALRDHGWHNVSVEVVANSWHQVVDEQPAAVADLLERYAAR
jgi:hypothetical protein